jgi:hypothetical protein
MSGAQVYTSKVMNRSGYVVMLPNVGDMDDLIQTNPPNPYAESLTQLFPLGTKLVQGERVWRYAKAGAAIGISAPVQSAAPVHAEQFDDIVVAAASAIGAYTVTLTSTANLDGSPNDEANAFAEGYLVVNDEAGEGQCYKIKSNEALVTTGNSIFTLYDPLTIALTTDSEVGIAMNPYCDVIATAAVVTALPVGVAQIAVTGADYYFWLQSGGPAAINMHAAAAVGDPISVGTTAAKGDPAAAFATETVIGFAMTPGITDDEKCMIFLTLDR